MRFRDKTDMLEDRVDVVRSVLSALETLLCSLPSGAGIQFSTKDCEGVGFILGACAETLKNTE